MGRTASFTTLMTVPFRRVSALREQPDAITGTSRDLAGVVVILPGYDAQQRGLARAVQSEHADLGAVIKAERDVAQDLFVRRDETPHTVHGIDDLRGFR
jgi:hypothetical protein